MTLNIQDIMNSAVIGGTKLLNGLEYFLDLTMRADTRALGSIHPLPTRLFASFIILFFSRSIHHHYTSRGGSVCPGPQRSL